MFMPQTGSRPRLGLAVARSRGIGDYSFMPDQFDYRQFYDDEAYLLAVGRTFRQTGTLGAADFYMMLVWKANRAKNYHRKRLKQLSGASFEVAVSRIASGIHSRLDSCAKLEFLMQEWGFYLPTASAILTLLYPSEFTVYDVMVCGELGWDYKPNLSFSSKLWNNYQSYKQAVVDATPAGLSLRDRDRFLIGRAYRKSVEQECRM